MKLCTLSEPENREARSQGWCQTALNSCHKHVLSCHAQHLERVLYHEEFHGIRPFLKHCSESVKSLTTKLETKFLARAIHQAAVTATNEDGQSKALYSECHTGKSPSNYIGIRNSRSCQRFSRALDDLFNEKTFASSLIILYVYIGLSRHTLCKESVTKKLLGKKESLFATIPVCQPHSASQTRQIHDLTQPPKYNYKNCPQPLRVNLKQDIVICCL